MQALAVRLEPYEVTRVGSPEVRGLFAALSGVVSDATVPSPEPAPDGPVADEIPPELARQALVRHLARLQASGPDGTEELAQVIDLERYRLRRAG